VRGVASLSGRPDTGIAGKMTILIEGGKHSYELEYTLGGTEHEEEAGITATAA
jgi:hypothetical protein